MQRRPPTIPVLARVDRTIYQLLVAEARAKDRSKSWVLRRIVEAYYRGQ